MACPNCPGASLPAAAFSLSTPFPTIRNAAGLAAPADVMLPSASRDWSWVWPVIGFVLLIRKNGT